MIEIPYECSLPFRCLDGVIHGEEFLKDSFPYDTGKAITL